MKKVVITVDNYKIDKFIETMIAKGFITSLSPCVHNTSIITVWCQEEQIPEVGKICQELQLHFQHRN